MWLGKCVCVCLNNGKITFYQIQFCNEYQLQWLVSYCSCFSMNCYSAYRAKMTLPSWLWKVSLRATPKLTQNCSLVSMNRTLHVELCVITATPLPPSFPDHLLHCVMVTPVDHALEQLISPHMFLCSPQHRHSLWCLSQPGLTGRLKISAGCKFILIILIKCGCVCLWLLVYERNEANIYIFDNFYFICSVL